MAINNFRGQYFFLSNFYNSKVKYDGITYENNESAFQSAKCKFDYEKNKFKNLDPLTAKRLGRKVKLRDDWEEIKYQVMLNVVKAKFEQNEDLREKLLDTKDEVIIEYNKWHDNEWGYCTCNRCNNKIKRNMLGKILMSVREKMKNK